MHKQVKKKETRETLSTIQTHSHMLNVNLWIWYRDNPIWVKYVISEIISQAIYYLSPKFP